MAQREWLNTDFYAVLGVAQDASADEIKKAYRKLAQKFHPDNNPDNAVAEAKFKEISEAHSILGDTDKRAEYDQVRQMGAGGFGGMGGGFGGGGGDFSDLLSQIFAGGGNPGGGMHRTYGGRPRPQKGMDGRADVHLSFEDAFQGVKTTLRVNGGEQITVKLPGGVQDGSVVRVAGRGGAGIAGGPKGDVMVHVHVENHAVFARRGNDVIADIGVTFSEAVLGTNLQIPLPDGGTTTIKIPAGTSSGKTLRLRGKGAPAKKGPDGDLLVKVRVDVPTKPSPDVQRLAEELAQHDDTSARDRLLFGDADVRSA